MSVQRSKVSVDGLRPLLAGSSTILHPYMSNAGAIELAKEKALPHAELYDA